MDGVGELAGLLRGRGWRMTKEREALLRLFMCAGRWFTPRELYEAAGKAGIKAGIATVYRLLEVLVEVGRAKPYVHGDRSLRYVFCGPDHHHHLICEDCGQVEDLARCHVEAPPNGFLVQEHSVDFFGLCPNCRSRFLPG